MPGRQAFEYMAAAIPSDPAREMRTLNELGADG